MVTFVTGRSGVGKTEYLMEQLPRLAAAHKHVFYIVPEQNSLALERRIGVLGADQMQVTSFRRLCNEIFRAFGGVAGSYMSPARETALIYRVLQEQRKNLCYYRSARPSMGFVGRLASVFEEFSMAGAEEGAMLDALSAAKRPDLVEKYQDLFLLYNTYRAAFDEENRSAAEDIAAATALARENGFFADCAVVLDGFFGFTGRQREFLSVIFGQSAEVYCALTADADSKEQLFAPVIQEMAGLKKLVEESGAKTVHHPIAGPSKRLAYQDLQLLEQRLFRLETEPFEAEHIRLMEGSHIREELAMVAADIAKKVADEGYRYKEIAIVAGSLEEYGIVAENVFRKYGIPLFIDQGRSGLGKPVIAFVRNALRIISADRYFNQADVLAFLKTDLCGLDRDTVSRIENYCTLWKVEGKRFTREWTQNPLGLTRENDEEAEARAAALLKKLNQARNAFVAPLLRFKAAIGKTGADLARAVYQLLLDFKVEQQMLKIAEKYQQEESALAIGENRRLAKEYMKVYGALMDILDDIYVVFEEAPLSVYAMEELIGLCSEQAMLNVAPPTLDAVSMGEIAHSRLEGVRALYVVGANQGLLPVPAKDSGLITDRERQFFEEKNLPCNATIPRHSLQGQHRLYAALFSAREALTFSFSVFEITGDRLQPSFYIERIKKLTGLKPIRCAEMDLYDFALTPEGARDLIGWAPHLRDEILEELGEKKIEKEYTLQDRLSKEIADQLFKERIRLSYSRISDYYKCPFQYFLSKTMAIEPLEPMEFDSRKIGDFVHYGLELLVNQIIEEREKGSLDYKNYDEAALRRYGQAMAQNYLDEKLKDFNRSERFLALFDRMTNLFCETAARVVQEFKDGSYIPYATEFDLSGSVDLPLADGKRVELIGRVDRVDICALADRTYLKVVDYKTGGQTFDMKSITNRNNVQLPIYLYGLIHSGKFKNPVAGAGCYMSTVLPDLEKRLEGEALEKKVRDHYRRDGAFNREKAALNALDYEAGSRNFKIDYNTSGKNKGAISAKTKAYEPELMEELTNHMETVLKETAQEIVGGNVEVLPLKDGYNVDGCKYCNFSHICGFDSYESPIREYSKDPEGWRKEAEE